MPATPDSAPHTGSPHHVGAARSSTAPVPSSRARALSSVRGCPRALRGCPSPLPVNEAPRSQLETSHTPSPIRLEPRSTDRPHDLMREDPARAPQDTYWAYVPEVPADSASLLNAEGWAGKSHTCHEAQQ